MAHGVWYRRNVSVALAEEFLVGKVASLYLESVELVSGVGIHIRNDFVVSRNVLVAQIHTLLVARCYHEQGSVLV